MAKRKTAVFLVHGPQKLLLCCPTQPWTVDYVGTSALQAGIIPLCDSSTNTSTVATKYLVQPAVKTPEILSFKQLPMGKKSIDSQSHHQGHSKKSLSCDFVNCKS